jgi:hypothetical protein
MLEAIRRTLELAAIENLSDDDLIKLYYEGAVPLRKRLKKQTLLILEMPKK